MKFRICVFGLIFLLTACAIPLVDRENPDAQVTSFELLPSDGITPRFKIGLHIGNPTWMPLEVKGLTYHVEVEGRMILSGITNEFPVMKAYGKGDVFIEVSMINSSSVRLLNDLLSQRETLKYSLIAKLDVGVLRPSIRINKTGEISLENLDQQ